MKRICDKCKVDMVDDCKVSSMATSLVISRKKKVLFENFGEEVKAAVCPNCGLVDLYVENYKSFSQ